MIARVERLPVIAVSGLAFEARIAAGPGIVTVFGLDSGKLAAGLEAELAAGARGVISFGTAGGLDPTARPGDIVIASSVVTEDHEFASDNSWSRSLAAHFAGNARLSRIAGAGQAITTPQAKDVLYRQTGAAVVDMESYLAARVAARYSVPFAALRVVIDPASRAIPRAALAGTHQDGSTNIAGVMRELVRDPRQIGALVQLAGDARAARASLLRCRQALGPLFSFPYRC